MSKSFLIFICVLFSLTLSAQENVGIGTTTPHPKSLLDLSSANKGLLIPRMSTDRRENMNLDETGDGMMVYDLQNHSIYCWNGLLLQWQHIMFTNYNQGFNISNFVGAQNHLIKFATGISPGNSVIVDNGTNVGIGNVSPTAKLQVTGGDVYIDTSLNGVVLKSPNGTCWRVTIDNSGSLITTAIACP